MNKIKLLLVVILATISINAFAWWDLGHFLTASIAYIEISHNKKVLKGIENCLKQPIAYPPKPKYDFSPLNMISTSTWLDNIKGGEWSNSTEKYQFSNIHFCDMYYDVDENIDSYEKALKKVEKEKKLTKYNSLTASEACIKSLAEEKTSKVEKAVALRTLIHLLGDIHCPMHSIDPTINNVGTRGGNGILFSKNAGIKFYDLDGNATPITNMHKLWDGMGGAYKNFAYPVKNINYMYLEDTAQKILDEYHTSQNEQNDVSINSWAASTLLLGEHATSTASIIYPELGHAYSDIIKYNEEYSKFAQNESKKQVYLAGTRLAEILTAIYDKNDANQAYINLVKNIKEDNNISSLQEYMGFKFK